VEKQHKVDSSVPLLPPKTADISHLHCSQPRPAIAHTKDVYAFVSMP